MAVVSPCPRFFDTDRLLWTGLVVAALLASGCCRPRYAVRRPELHVAVLGAKGERVPGVHLEVCTETDQNAGALTSGQCLHRAVGLSDGRGIGELEGIRELDLSCGKV